MSKIYPEIDYTQIPEYSERVIYQSLKNISDDFVVFYSVPWIKYNIGRANTWYENDFIILHKRMGMFVLEVKGGKIECIDGVIHQINQKNGTVSILDSGNDPLSQAIRGIYHYRKEFEKSIPDITFKLGINPLIWFPSSVINDISLFPQQYKNISHAILGDSSFENLEKHLMMAYNGYKSKENTNLTDEEFSLIKQILAPTFNLTVSRKFERGQIKEKFLLLTREQNTLLDYISEIRLSLVQGAAGTGKTLLAIEAAKRGVQEGKKVLFLCFNHFLKESISKTNNIEGVDYFTIDSFVLRNFPQFNIGDSYERASYFKKLENVLNKYDIIIIDEAQDFENEEIEFLQALSEICDKKMMMFYDKNQIVNKYDVPKWIINSECKLLLSKNCRNTYEIASTSYNVIDNEIKQSLTAVSGEQPRVLFSNDELYDLQRLIEYYHSEEFGFLDDDITILTLSTEQSSFMYGINIVGKSKISSEKKKGHILFTTARKFKGLESDVVIIVDINQQAFSIDKKLFYVACSRARHHLSLLINSDNAPQIAKEISDLNIKNPNKKIIVKTKTKIF